MLGAIFNNVQRLVLWRHGSCRRWLCRFWKVRSICTRERERETGGRRWGLNIGNGFGIYVNADSSIIVSKYPSIQNAFSVGRWNKSLDELRLIVLCFALEHLFKRNPYASGIVLRLFLCHFLYHRVRATSCAVVCFDRTPCISLVCSLDASIVGCSHSFFSIIPITTFVVFCLSWSLKCTTRVVVNVYWQ